MAVLAVPLLVDQVVPPAVRPVVLNPAVLLVVAANPLLAVAASPLRKRSRIHNSELENSVPDGTTADG
jgi:hypothetical protein